jgi:hypothetical protein
VHKTKPSQWPSKRVKASLLSHISLFQNSISQREREREIPEKPRGLRVPRDAGVRCRRAQLSFFLCGQRGGPAVAGCWLSRLRPHRRANNVQIRVRCWSVGCSLCRRKVDRWLLESQVICCLVGLLV